MKIPQKIPTFLGILLTIITVGIVIFVVEQVTRMPSRATNSKEPKNIQITNVSDTTFSVTWMTSESTTGFITISVPGQIPLPVFDERDVAKKLGEYTTHSVVYRNATPNTQYSLTLLSGGQLFNATNPLTIRTGPLLPSGNQLGTLEPAYGTIMTVGNTPAGGALVYLTLEDGQTLSTITGKSGTWLIPLNVTRNKELSDYMKSAPRMTETIQVYLNGDQITAITDTLNDSPVPNMELGKSYDFRKQQAKSTSPQLANSTTAPTVLGEQTQSYSFTLASPTNGAALVYPRPLFEGNGIPGKRVDITISPAPVLTGSVTVGPDGTWRFTPDRPLGEGGHIVSVTSFDGQNQKIVISQTLRILKSGSQVLGDATPSATLSPSATLVPTPTTLASPTGSVSPTTMLTPTATPVLTGQPVPVTGSGFGHLGYVVIAGAIILLCVGLAF